MHIRRWHELSSWDWFCFELYSALFQLSALFWFWVATSIRSVLNSVDAACFDYTRSESTLHHTLEVTLGNLLFFNITVISPCFLIFLVAIPSEHFFKVIFKVSETIWFGLKKAGTTRISMVYIIYPWFIHSFPHQKWLSFELPQASQRWPVWWWRRAAKPPPSLDSQAHPIAGYDP